MIQRALLFKPGDVVSVRVIEETERILLGATTTCTTSSFRPIAYHDGVVDIEVMTRDTWSLDFGLRASRSGGANTSGFAITDRNLLGTGTTLSLGRSSNVDRSGNEFQFANDRAFGTLDIGEVQPCHQQRRPQRRGGRRSALLRAGHPLGRRRRRIEVRPHRLHLQRRQRDEPVPPPPEMAEVFGGWSAGLVEWLGAPLLLGVSASDDAYATEPGLVAPPQLPTDQKLVGPFVRFELVEDRFDKQLNRNLIGRPEFFALGLASTVQLGWASTGWGRARMRCSTRGRSLADSSRRPNRR